MQVTEKKEGGSINGGNQQWTSTKQLLSNSDDVCRQMDGKSIPLKHAVFMTYDVTVNKPGGKGSANVSCKS